ncbi:glyoxalase/bleomycin resistance/extradiol dioxygenase family protein [Neobacillus notoginsengisoli]|uniref:Glyoxalase/bleomycin resistance/extradiol dioxygenase family protein n=1 Tax=Neobacillus notoginsengisoli TaxID=1578198 RepID=A0A417YS46_9BACI|nr:VOC family protein [Neobacillus notoginsengisoli]RHW38111.1 glyoxalase/bleomycin resistance/extradiol dioxygenase family protein [Neobacillus notoginsengisoli]
MALKAEKLFVNLPVKDLQKSIEFFKEIGFEFEPRFTDDNATCMIIGENIYTMLLVEEFFQTFTKKEVVDSTRSTEVILSLTAGSRGEVDAIVSRAIDAGGKLSNDPQDHGFMYSWSFQDLDGHLWEVFYMEPGIAG